MMIGMLITGCVLSGIAAAVWYSPLRSVLVQKVSIFDRYRFTCRVQQFTDESLPEGKDQFFRVDMIGRIATERDGIDTDVRLEIFDITEGHQSLTEVLISDEQFQRDDSVEFYYIRNHGVVPQKNAVLARWVTVESIPCHALRLACRGRRKLLFCITVVESDSGREIVTARQAHDYVYCHEGYREVQGRRLDVLRVCVELAAAALDTDVLTDVIREFWSQWIQQKAEMIVSDDQASESIEAVEQKLLTISVQEAADTVLAYGQKTDSFSAMELALQSVALSGNITRQSFEILSQTAEALEIKPERFLEMTQKIVLSSSGCCIEDPSWLFGLTTDMDVQSFRKRLNEEYRKWNARVTHPDPQIRDQADRILTLIAEIRSQQLSSCSK